MDDTTQMIVFGVVAPIVVAAALVIPGTKGCMAYQRDRRAWRIVAALAIVIAGAMLVMEGWPDEKWKHVTYVPMVGLALGITTSLLPRGVITWLLASFVSAAATTAVVWPILEPESWSMRLTPGVATFVLLLVLEPLARRRPGVSLPLVLALSCGAAAALVLWAGSMSLAVAFGALAPALVVMTAIALWRCGFSLADGPLLVIVPMLCVTPIVAWLYDFATDDPLPALAFLLPASAAAFAWVGEIKFLRKGSPWIAVPARLLAATIPCAIVAWLIFSAGSDVAAPDGLEEMYRQLEGG